MTVEEKQQYQQAIESVIAEYGFVFSRIGCPCSGSQRIYTVSNGKARFTIELWVARRYWHIYESKMKVSYGTKPEYLQQELKRLWDLFS